MANLNRDQVARITIACMHFGAWNQDYPRRVGQMIKKNSKDAGAIIQNEVIAKARRELPKAIMETARRDNLPSGTQFVDVDWIAIVARPETRAKYLAAEGVNAKAAADWLNSELAKVDAKFANA